MSLWLSIDPGPHTGVCVWESKLSTHEMLAFYQFDSPDAFLAEFEKTIGAYDFVVIEEFKLFYGKREAMVGSAFPEVEIIGVVRWLCKKHTKPLYLQKADNQKTGGRVAARSLNMTPPRGMGPHCLSAYYHGLYYIRFKMKGDK